MPTPARSFIAFPALLLASAALLSGCTTSLSAALDTGTSAPSPGIPYRLPTKALVVDATWLPDSCEIIKDAKGDLLVVPGFTTAATLAEQLGEGERLVIDYTKMATTFKTGKIDVSYWKLGEGNEARPTALLKSFNAEIKGEEAAALAAGIKAAGSIASLAMGLPVPVTAGAGIIETTVPDLICNPALFAPAGGQGETGHITRLKQMPARQKTITQAIADKTLQLSAIKTRTLGTLSDRDQQMFDKLNADEEKLVRESEALKKDAVLISASFGLKHSITHTPRMRIPSGASPIELHRAKPDQKELESLLAKFVTCNPEATLSPDQCKSSLEDFKEVNANRAPDLVNELAILLYMHAPVAELTAEAVNSESSLALAAQQGLAFREPAAMRFSLELPALADADTNKPARRAAETLAAATIMVPQLGRISYLPLKSDFGEKAGLEAEFEQDGMPSRISYKKLESGGAALAKSLQLGADEVAGLISANKAKADAKAKEAAGSELANLNARIELLTAQNKIATLEKAATPDPAATDREAELAILRFNKEKAELRQAIAKATAQ